MELRTAHIRSAAFGLLLMILTGTAGCADLNRALEAQTEIVVPAEWLGGPEGQFITLRSSRNSRLTIEGLTEGPNFGKPQVQRFEYIGDASGVISTRGDVIANVEAQRLAALDRALERIQNLLLAVIEAQLRPAPAVAPVGENPNAGGQ